MAGDKSTSNYFLWRLQRLLYRLSLLSTLIKAIQGNKCVHQMKENSYKHLSNNLQIFQISLSTWFSMEMRSRKSFFLLPLHLVCLFTGWLCDVVDRIPSTKNQSCVGQKEMQNLCEYFTKILFKNLMAVLIIRHRVVLKLGTSMAYPGIAFLF